MIQQTCMGSSHQPLRSTHQMSRRPQSGHHALFRAFWRMTLRPSARTTLCQVDKTFHQTRFLNRTLRQAWTWATVVLRRQGTWRIHTMEIWLWMTLIHLQRFRSRSRRTTYGEIITRPATTRRKEIPDGIQVCKYATMAKGREEAKANLSRKERSTLMPPSGKFQILEQQPVLLASDYSLRMILSNRAIFSAKEFLCNSREVTYQVTSFLCQTQIC